MGVKGRVQNNNKITPRKILDYTLPMTNQELQSECKISVYRSSGPGGQSVNTTNSAVRIIHMPTGIIITTQDERSQYLNLKKGLERLRAKIIQMQYIKPERIASKPSKAAIEKRLQEKKTHSDKKIQRNKNFFD